MSSNSKKAKRKTKRRRKNSSTPDPNDPVFQVAQKRKAQTKERICLGCPRTFISRGPGHRFCPVCSKKRAKTPGERVYRVSGPDGRRGEE